MPQVFQVLKCFKCSIFQVHQTKKINKWICKVCNEKQSVKRHYGIGTAKDCRIHVQKLNNLKGDIEESQFKYVDSEDNEYEDAIEDNTNINNNTEALTKESNINIQQESKWLAYIETEKTSKVNETMCLDNKEVFVQLPRKRKQKQTMHKNKILKTSSDDESAELSCNGRSNNFQYNSHDSESVVYEKCKSDIIIKRNEEFSSQANISLRNENSISQCPVVKNEDSKWAKFTEKDKNHFQHCDEYEFAKYTEIIDSKSVKYDNYHCKEGYSNRNVEKSGNKNMFSLCDESDLDKVLDI